MNAVTQNFESQEKPAFVKFETRAKTTSNGRIETGRPVYENVDFAIIRPAGTDALTVVEKEVDDWLKNLLDRQDQFYRHYKTAYEAWKAAQDDVGEGTSIRLWPAVTPADVEQCLSAGINTIEALAEADDGAIEHLGTGGQALINRAKSWLETASNASAVAEQNAALLTQVGELEKLGAEKDEEIKNLSARVEELEGQIPATEAATKTETKPATKSSKAK